MPTAYSLAVATADQTQTLWQEYRKSKDQELRDRLILTYAPLVKFVAGRVGASLPSHVDEQDLVSYGLLGLIGAIERFDPDREIKFETFAMARIRGAIIDELRSLDWVPRSVRTRARGRSSARSPRSRRSSTARRRTRRSRRSSVSPRRSSTTACSRSRAPRSAPSTSSGRRRRAATRSRSSTRSRTSPAPIRRSRSSRPR